MAYGDAGQSGGQSGQGGYCAIHVESESAFPDYDYKIEGGKTYIVKENDVYKAIKSFTKGQYYGN